ncbi:MULTISPECIES: dihydroxy-acid dehydratase [unclassified Streptomyces]|uniref:dihydroxy-acid dehydratase n=1 Tax=unclassified Streptomyces TaxID=2593676 RepID=UPI002E27DDA3|nr:dihydroxy-acid dehydratase [Streptomyces sp. NBC_00223]
MTGQEAHGFGRGLTSYGDRGFSRYLRQAFLASAGFDAEDWERPIVGIAHTISDYVTCHRQMPELVDSVRRGIQLAGGLGMAFPVTSLGEIFLSPTSMMFRNLAAMEAEELVKAQPMDAVVFVGGCDKTVPAQMMAAVSADVPALFTVAGPMLTGSWHGKRLGACTDCRRYWTEHRAGVLDEEEINDVRDSLCQTAGTCSVMGTASTMACVVEALGMMLPGGATMPAPSGARLRHGAATGRLAAGLTVRPSAVLTAGAFRNALVVLCAIGGSTNAVIHLLAIARRAGVPLSLDDFAEISRITPVLVDCKPAGAGYLEDLDRAGGVPVLMKALEPLLDLSAVGVGGESVGDLLARTGAPQGWQSTIRSLDDPLKPANGLAVLTGTLAPDGAILKASAATESLLRHRGPAVVFDGPEDLERRLDDPALSLTPQHVLVMRNAGPIAAGMPEAGLIPIPRRLAEQGVRDMVRVSDARMSGTGYGTVILHVSPEAAAGGPLALVKDGDMIELNAFTGKLDLLVESAELAARRRQWQPPALPERGWRRLFAEHVAQADRGADLDFL